MKLEDEIKQKFFKSPQQKLAINLLFTSNWLNYHLSGFFKEQSITSQQFNVLRILRGQYPDACSLKLIKERMLDRMSDASRIVDKLVVKGYIEKAPSSVDKRSVKLLITAKGMDVLNKLDYIESATTDIFKHLDEDETSQLNDLLDKLRG